MKICFVVNTHYNYLYNLKKSLESIKVKNHKHEIMVVIDGGSKNKTAELKRKYEYIDNIAFYSIKKSGISLSRNFAINKTNSNWITFLDGDDIFFKTNFLEKKLDKSYDFLIFNSKISNKSSPEFYQTNKIINQTQKKKFIKKYLSLPRANSSVNHVWSKVYSVKFLKKNKIKFKKNLNVNEDFLFNSRCFLYAKKVFFHKKHFLIYHNISNTKKTALRHISNNSYNYLLPIKILSTILSKVERLHYYNKAQNYWKGKIDYLNNYENK